MHRVGRISALILLLGGAAWAFSPKTKKTHHPAEAERPDAHLERRKTAPHFERRTLLADARRRPKAAVVETTPVEYSDPFSRAVWAPNQTEGFVVEVSALLHSSIGEAFKGCRRFEQQRAEIEEAFEIDVLYDLDRLGVADRGVVLSGRFRSLRRRLEAEEHETYGDAIIFEHKHRKVALWRDELLLLDRSQYTKVIDRIEGRAPSGSALAVLGDDVLRGSPPDDFARRKIFDVGRSDKDAIPKLRTDVTMRATWPPVITVNLRAPGDEERLFALVDGPRFESLRTLAGPLKQAVDHLETQRTADGIELELHLKADFILRGFGCGPTVRLRH